MKPVYLILLWITPLFVRTQNIYISDGVFKQQIVSQYDTSRDGEIQIGEALAIRNLRIYELGIWHGSGVEWVSPDNLTGIESFSNLESLVLDAPGTRYVNVSGLTNLKSIKLNGFYGELNKLTKLKVTGCSALDSLILHGENFLFDSLDLSSCINLRFLECYSIYRMQSLTLQGCINLKVIHLGMVGCYNLNLSGLLNLEEISLGSDGGPEIGYFTEWGSGNFTNLRKIFLANAWVSNLNFSQSVTLESLDLWWTGFSTQNIDLSNATRLTHINLWYGYLQDSINRLNSLNFKNGSPFADFVLDTAFHFQYICADDFEIDTLQQYFANMGQHPIISSSCSFSPVPVKLEYFSINKKENSNQLNWKASCTYGNAIFIIERSDDGVYFNSIGNINATSLRCQLPFNFTDNNPVAGKNYYRLKITDADGKSFYSKTIVVGNNKAGLEITAVANNIIYLNSNKQQTITVKVIAADEKEIYNERKTIVTGSNTINLQMKNMAKGIYTLIVYTGEAETIIKRFVK